MRWQNKSAVAFLIKCVLFWFSKTEARTVVPFWDTGHRYSTGVDKMNKWHLIVPSRDLLSAGAGKIDGMKHLNRGVGGATDSVRNRQSVSALWKI